ncbi:MAG: methionine--tRNA ligase [Christensenellales bacterium]|jgi:methionyl-tRNA synthetase
MDKKIFIGNAWLYANNSMHIGHLAALLPGDVLARFFRKNGNEVVFVSGSDCHGTPITIRAENLNVSPKEIATHYDTEFTKTFADLGFTYDIYTNTMTEEHKQNVQNLLLQIDKNGFLYEKTEEEDFCTTCNKFKSDRELKGICPICNHIADGDQCDNCLTALKPEMLKDKVCKKCGNPTILQPNTHLYFEMSALTNQVTKYFNANKENWRQTAINETNKYITEGLHDRTISRSLNWGIELPFKGFEDKRVYVWIEAVIGYLTACQMAAKQKGINFEEFITDKNLVPYYVHGKDNIVFHTIILPALLYAINPNIIPPKMIVSCEYINFNNDKMSKSKGNLITVNTLLANFDSDAIRYYFILNNPERKDASFNLDDFLSIYQKHLLGGYGNFVNRNLAFLVKKFEGKLPKQNLDNEVVSYTENLYKEVKALYEQSELKAAATRLYEYVQFANRYYDNNTPWTFAKEDPEKFDAITSNCIYMIANIANLFEPIMPKRTQMIKDILKVELNNFEPVTYDENVVLADVPVLFTRIEPEKIDMTKGAQNTFEEYLKNKN